jgi:protein gp37
VSDRSKIQWTDATWQVTRGCTVYSPGCTNCYAMKMAHRFSGPGKAYERLTVLSKGGPVWTGDVRTVPENLEIPLRWRNPRRIFVDSMSDLFHESVPDDFIDRVFAVMALCPQHTFQVLTKRAERMRAYMDDLSGRATKWAEAAGDDYMEADSATDSGSVPLSNVHLGVSVEDQPRKARIDVLREVPAALRFLSLEPLLEDLGTLDLRGIGWCIVGGESGPGARPCEIRWIRSIRDQCAAAKVPLFIKQVGSRPVVHGEAAEQGWGPGVRFEEHAREDGPCELRLADRKGGDPSEWPEDLRVREMPQ